MLYCIPYIDNGTRLYTWHGKPKSLYHVDSSHNLQGNQCGHTVKSQALQAKLISQYIHLPCQSTINLSINSCVDSDVSISSIELLLVWFDMFVYSFIDKLSMILFMHIYIHTFIYPYTLKYIHIYINIYIYYIAGKFKRFV